MKPRPASSFYLHLARTRSDRIGKTTNRNWRSAIDELKIGNWRKRQFSNWRPATNVSTSVQLTETVWLFWAWLLALAFGLLAVVVGFDHYCTSKWNGWFRPFRFAHDQTQSRPGWRAQKCYQPVRLCLVSSTTSLAVFYRNLFDSLLDRYVGTSQASSRTSQDRREGRRAQASG